MKGETMKSMTIVNGIEISARDQANGYMYT